MKISKEQLEQLIESAIQNNLKEEYIPREKMKNKALDFSIQLMSFKKQFANYASSNGWTMHDEQNMERINRLIELTNKIISDL